MPILTENHEGMSLIIAVPKAGFDSLSLVKFGCEYTFEAFNFGITKL